MKYTITKLKGKKAYHFQVEGINLFEVVSQASKLSFPDVLTCGCCVSDHLELMTRKAQDKFSYTFVKCFDCKTELTFGQQMEDKDVFYLRKNEQGELDWRKQQPQQQAPNQQQQRNGYQQ